MNLNRAAVAIAEEMVGKREELKVEALELKNGTTVIDCGLKAPGGLGAGRLFALACMGGLAEIGLGLEDYGGIELLTVRVATDHPIIACLASQKAGWSIKGEKFFALGSGPARILARKPKKTFERVRYTEVAGKAVIALEVAKYPTEAVAEEIARECGIKTEDLYILVARTASVAGAIQVSARAVETALYRMDHLDFDLVGVRGAVGTAPVAPLVGDDGRMMGITNDMIIYGGKVYISSSAPMDPAQIPSSNSKAYGKPFAELFEEAGHDFYKIPPETFAPASVTIESPSGLLRAGALNPGVIKRSIGLG
ncbi:MAG: methenyltetrahydromethanopterin cyclohydrolase [Euryarchaeota archaeon]|nr:methenyltetrahydromethanopterin cyclohydrolase [Euryarchaeota archaeon]